MLTREQEMETREKLHELLDLALDVNGFEDRRTEVTGCMPTVFFSFSGHVNQLEIEISPEGWKDEERPREIFRTYLDAPVPDSFVESIKKCARVALWEGKEKADAVDAGHDED